MPSSQTASALMVQHQASLAGLNTFGIDATARVLITLDDLSRLDEVLSVLHQESLAAPAIEGTTIKGAATDSATTRGATAGETTFRPLILSGGSNIILARDLVEPVLLVRHRGRRIVSDERQQVLVDVAAGEIWHDIVRWTLDEGCFGLENLALIPGRVGAAPWQNIGAYGAEAGQFIDSVDAVHLQSGERRRFARHECRFAYRQSFFKTPEGRDWLILSVRFRLSRRFHPQLAYGELAAAIDRKLESETNHPDAGNTRQNALPADARARSTHRPPTPDAVMPLTGPEDAATPPEGLTARLVADTVEEIRRRKLPDPAVLGNAGSFFHNPVVDVATLQRLRRLHPALPAHPVPDARSNAVTVTTDKNRSGGAHATVGNAGTRGHADSNEASETATHYKLSAGWLIDACGWKGHRDGDAGVSPHHALVLVNHGNASGADILRLAGRIQQSVAARFGVQLHPEPLIIR